MSSPAAALTRFRTAYAAMLGAARALNTALEEAAREKHALAPLPEPEHYRAIAIIQTLCAAHYGVPVDLLLSPRRYRSLVDCRQVAMTLTRQLTRHTLEEIGDAFHRDHGTVIYAERAITDRLQTEVRFGEDFTTLRETVRAALEGEAIARPAA